MIEAGAAVSGVVEPCKENDFVGVPKVLHVLFVSTAVMDAEGTVSAEATEILRIHPEEADVVATAREDVEARAAGFGSGGLYLEAPYFTVLGVSCGLGVRSGVPAVVASKRRVEVVTTFKPSNSKRRASGDLSDISHAH